MLELPRCQGSTTALTVSSKHGLSSSVAGSRLTRALAARRLLDQWPEMGIASDHEGIDNLLPHSKGFGISNNAPKFSQPPA